MVNTDGQPSLTLPSPSAHPERPAHVTAVGRGVRVTGQIEATEHVIIEGEFEGEITIPDHGLAIGGTARVGGEIFAKTITVLGRVDGNLRATALIELRSSAVVIGRLTAPKLSIEDGALFRGHVDQTPAEMALPGGRRALPADV